MPGTDEKQDQTESATPAPEETPTPEETEAPAAQDADESDGTPTEGAAAEPDAPQDVDADEPGEEQVLEPEVVEEPPSPEAVALAALEAEHAVVKADLEQTQGRLRAVSKAYRDLQEDMAAFRERVEQQGKTKEEQRAVQVVKTFFDPVQNLKRSVTNPGEDLESLVAGLKLTLHQFTSALEKLGLQEVPGEGALFDPNVHEALAITPVLDEEQDGKVIMVHSTGYQVKGKVVQAAQVVVGKYEEQPAEA